MLSMIGNTIHSIQPVLSHHQIEKLTHSGADLGSAASSHYARGLCSMPNLRSLDLSFMKLSDEFYSTMASEASKSKVYQTWFLFNTIFVLQIILHSSNSTYEVHCFHTKKKKKFHIFISYEDSHINIINSFAMPTRKKNPVNRMNFDVIMI